MSILSYNWIARNQNPIKMSRRLRTYLILIFLSCGIISSILLGLGFYGEAGPWCWIKIEFGIERLCCFYLILVICWVVTGSTIALTSSAMAGRLMNGGDVTITGTIQAKLHQYMFVFFVTWFIALLNRFIEFGTGNMWFITTVLEACVLPLQGFLNSACYGGLFDCNSKHKEDTSAMNIVIAGRPGSSGIELRTCNDVPSSSTPHPSRLLPSIEFKRKNYSIFTSTLNLGEADVLEMIPFLEKWILRDHDIYAIGVQECIDLKGFRDLILEHLGGKSKYTMFAAEIGSSNTKLGYHGYIALTAYVRTDDIDRGNVRLTDSAKTTMATGTNLIVTTAQNKGAVGLLFEVNDTSVGFVTAHLPSDTKGKSKLHKRNESIDTILREVVLAREDTGFDLHLQVGLPTNQIAFFLIC